MDKIIPTLFFAAVTVVATTMSYNNYVEKNAYNDAVKMLNNDARIIMGDKHEYPNKLNHSTMLLSINYKRLLLTAQYRTNDNPNDFKIEELIQLSRQFIGVNYLCQKEEYKILPITIIYKVHFKMEDLHTRHLVELSDLCKPKPIT